MREKKAKGVWGSARPAYAALSAQPVAAHASSLPHSVLLFCTPLRACEAIGGGCAGYIPGQRLNLVRFQCWNLLPTAEIVGFQELQDGVGINPSSARYSCNPWIYAQERRRSPKRNEARRTERPPRPAGKKGMFPVGARHFGIVGFLGLFSRLGWRVGWDGACVTFVREI